jgi:hypothetical protein
VAADIESTPNSVSPNARDSAPETSPVYGISLPASGATATATPTTIYIGDDGQVTATASSALYRLNVWTIPPTTTQQETFVRLLITWPAAASYTAPQGYVENVVALNRT